LPPKIIAKWKIIMSDELKIDAVELESNDKAAQGSMLLGEVLLAARLAKNLTQKDVSDNLRLSIKQIEALETNTFSWLPAPMITRGFIRNYARFLALDAEPLLASYRSLVPDQLPNMLSVQTSIAQVMPARENQSWVKYILASILVLLFLFAWFFYMDYMPKSVKKSSDLAVVANVPEQAIALPEIALPTAERAVDANDSVVIEARNSTSNVVNSVAEPVASAVVASVALPKTPPAAQLAKAKVSDPANKQDVALKSDVVPNSGVTTNSVVAPKSSDLASLTPTAIEKHVSMSFAEKTWVRVTNKSGKVIFEKMLEAGSTDAFDALPPMNVVIGNAKAAKLIYAGKSVDLNLTTNSNVARVTLE
jgi:cytoskeleton protein RodZ